MIQIKKGLDLPIAGAPEMRIAEGKPISHVALVAADYHDMKPSLLVAVGDRVALGQTLFTDKKHQSIHYTSPASGEVVAINRGARRAFLSLVVKISGDDEKTFPATAVDQLPGLASEAVEQRLREAGLWTALRTRPYSKVPSPGDRPAALFVTAIDTNPLAADPQIIIAERSAEFGAGLQVLRHLTDGAVYLCKQPASDIPLGEGVTVSEFAGCHPAGLVGTHIHFLERIDQERQVWHIGYQDVIAVGHLFLTGRILTERIVALGGPSIMKPRLLRTRLGASLGELVKGQLIEGRDHRVISGSVLSGRHALDPVAFLGRYHNQVSVLREEPQRDFLGWLGFGRDKFSAKKVFVSSFMEPRPLPLGTSTHGSLRAMVPVGAYEKVMPLNVKATWLLRSLLTLDTDLAQQLGCLELDEEDLALCSFVCPGKMNYGPCLREALRKIEIEG